MGDLRISLLSEIPDELVSDTVEATEGLRSLLLMSFMGLVGVVGWECACGFLYRAMSGLSVGLGFLLSSFAMFCFHCFRRSDTKPSLGLDLLLDISRDVSRGQLKDCCILKGDPFLVTI